MDARLEYFQMAKEMNTKYASLLQERSLHCRGNFNSMSLISVYKKTPERGFSKIKNEEELKSKIDQWDELEKPGRSTPEKSLQAWIIKNALNSPNHHLVFGDEIKFITSEIAIKEENQKIVNDILGFNNNGELCIIELKYARHLDRLCEQIESFEDYVEKNPSLFKDLLEIHGCKWDGQKIKRIIVWPYSKSSRESTKNSLKDKNITAYGYVQADDVYEFKAECIN